jgi:hypothetical protein
VYRMEDTDVAYQMSISKWYIQPLYQNWIPD